MAVRLSVLVLRPPGGGSTWHAHSDDLLGHLLGRPGFDVTLLERLPVAGEDTTETLALESIGGHVACLAWQDATEVVADLDRAGRPMDRRLHASDPNCDDAPAAGSGLLPPQDATRRGRMYFFDMRHQGRAEAVLGALQSLLQTLQVSTFQIGTPSKPSATARAVAPTQRSVSAIAAPDHSTRPTSSPSRPSRSSQTEAGGGASSQSDALDRLVDELDAFDS